MKAKLTRLISFAARSILNHTTAPLELISVIGFIASLLTFASTLIMAIIWVLKGVPFAGFGSIVSLIIFGFSLILLTIGVMAQYLSIIYYAVKQRPIYIVAETIGKPVEKI